MRLKLIIWSLVLFLSPLFANAVQINFVIGNNSILGDSYVTSNPPTGCSGASAVWGTDIRTTNKHRAYIQFNISNLTTLCNGANSITNVTLYAYLSDAPGNNYVEYIYEVNDTFKEGLCKDEGAQVDGDELVWNNQPCGAGFPSTTTEKCNSTSESSYTTPAVNEWGHWEITSMTKKAVAGNRGNVTMLLMSSESGGAIQRNYDASEKINGNFPYLNVTCEEASAAPGTTPPEISLYNMTSEGGAGCINWRTDKSNPCSTSDTTPTVDFTTNEPAACAIGTQDINISDYTALGIDRNCTIGQGTQSHTCTLASQDELVYDTSFIYISCEDSSGNQNRTSTSGALKLSITGLEVAGRTSIGIGIQNALLSGYTNYTDLQIYARNLSNSQARGTFDRVAKKGSKIWAFNRIGVSDSHVNMFNLTPVLYTLELANKTSTNITLQIEQLINATK